MAKEFLPLFLDFNETTQDLNDAQCGRLVRALVTYANGGQECSLQGMELMAFRFLKGSIDRNRRLSAVRAKAGSLGGQQTQANASKMKQNEANETNVQQKCININNDINNKPNNDINNDSLLDEDEARKYQMEQNRVLDAAEDAGFARNNSTRASLIRLYADYGLEKVLGGLQACVKHGAANLAYLEAVLKGSPRKEKAQVIAQDFTQRSYNGVNKELLAGLAHDMAEFEKGVG